jgi:hypothetical protein
VLVSQTVRDLVAGSGLAFEDRGTHVLKGVPNESYFARFPDKLLISLPNASIRFRSALGHNRT